MTVFPTRVAEPLVGFVIAVTVKVSPSTSESSFRSNIPDNVLLSSVDAVSFTATGASLTAVTVIVSVPVSVPPLPSETV